MVAYQTHYLVVVVRIYTSLAHHAAMVPYWLSGSDKINLVMAVHPFHLVDCSPWPFLVSFAMLYGAILVVSWIHHLDGNVLVLFAFVVIVLWWRDVIREAKAGYHTTVVQRGILIGFVLFLVR